MINPAELKHIKMEFIENEYIATLVDPSGFEVLKGYGSSIIEAINDMHQNLV